MKRNQKPKTKTIHKQKTEVPKGALLVTVHDAHPAGLTWLGAVEGFQVSPLGVTKFGQSGDINDLYQHYRIDTQAIVEAALAALAR